MTISAFAISESAIGEIEEAASAATGTFAATTRRNTLDASGTVNPVTGTLAAVTRRDTLDASGSVTSDEATGTFAAVTRRNVLDATGVVDLVTGTITAVTRRNTMSFSGISGTVANTRGCISNTWPFEMFEAA